MFARLPGKYVPDTALPTTEREILMDGYDTVDVGVCAYPAAPVTT